MDISFYRSLKGMLEKLDSLNKLSKDLKYDGTTGIEILVRDNFGTATRYGISDKSLINDLSKTLAEHINNLEKDVQAFIEDGRARDCE